jgi:hypothetical protein
MDKTTRLALLALLLTGPAAAQNRARVQTPTVPVIGGPALTAAGIGGLKAPSLAAPTLPSLPMPSVQPTLPAAASVLPRADAVAAPIPGVKPWPRVAGVGLAAPAEANGVTEKPAQSSLEAAAKGFGDEPGRSSPEASAKLAATFDASKLPRADAVADVIPGVRNWPRVMGVGLASPHDYNGVKEDKKTETPAPKKSDDEKPMGKWEAVGTGLLLAAALAGSLFLWYQIYASMGQVMYQAEQEFYQQYHGPVGGWEDLFGR